MFIVEKMPEQIDPKLVSLLEKVEVATVGCEGMVGVTAVTPKMFSRSVTMVQGQHAARFKR